jgi:hypothetical protein
VIKIRYAELPDGLHAQVERCGRQTIIHLAPGLSAPQRRDALGRLIRTSRRGHGPRLRPPGMSLAMARDVTRATMRNGLAAVRCHPAGALLLAAVLASAVVCYTLFVSVSIRMIPHPGHPQPPLAAPPVRDSGVPLPRASGTGPAAGGPDSGRPDPGSPSARASSGPSSPATRPVPSSTWSGPGGEVPSPSPGSSSPADPTPTASPSPGSAHPSPASPGGLCVSVGLFGVCLSG